MIEVAIQAITKAGELLKKNFYTTESAVLKSRKDFITKSDLESEKMILKVIKNNFPAHNIISEESGFENNGSDYTWIIDPLCSTNNFVYGLSLYGIAIALVFKSKPLLGTIYIPELDYLLTAEATKGAFLNDEGIHVSTRKKMEEAMVLYDNQFYKDKKMYPNLLKIVNKALTVRILGSAAVDLSLVALGRADARIFHKTKPCDFVAGALIIEEAGGKVTNFTGQKWSVKDTAIVASNGKIHNQILQVLKS